MRRTLLLLPLAALAALAALLAACRFEPDYDKYAIVYGLSDYQGLGNDLRYCDDDAQEMAALLAGQGFDVIVRVSVDATTDATHDQLLADFADVALRVGPADLFLFYYSGHGAQVPAADPQADEDAAGADAPDEAIVMFNLAPSELVFYLDDELSADLRAIPCDKKIVIVDACFSGGVIGNQLEHDAVPPDYEGLVGGFLSGLVEAISLYGSYDGRGSDVAPGNALVLAAAGEREESFEDDPPYENGVFTYFLLQAAARGDANGDGWVTLREAYAFTRRRIDAEWNLWVPLSTRFAPRVSGGPVDYVLFEARP